jgi:tripartite-type tricarboxylate transporter receptor subunit TctC
MPTLRLVSGSLLLAVLAVLNAVTVSAQNYPRKTIRIVTAEVGGGTNQVARLIAQGISGPLGQPVIVDNRSGVISVEVVAKALPDGYTVLLFGSTLWITPLLQSAPYGLNDFLPITLAVSSPNVLVVNPSLRVNSAKELIALAKAKPGELNYGTGSTGAPPHLAGELFKSMAGVNIVRIPYKGTGPAIIGLISGENQFMFPNAGVALPHIKSGRMRALAITTAQPSAVAPGLPTLAETVPGYESASMTAMFAPAQTPAALINRLNQEIVRALNSPEVKEPLFQSGVEAVGNSPEQVTAILKSEMARLGKVIKEAGIRAD